MNHTSLPLSIVTCTESQNNKISSPLNRTTPPLSWCEVLNEAMAYSLPKLNDTSKIKVKYVFFKLNGLAIAPQNVKSTVHANANTPHKHCDVWRVK